MKINLALIISIIFYCYKIQNQCGELILTVLCIFVFYTFQSPFNQVSYSIIGDDAAPSFFMMNSTSGWITLGRSLSSDTVTSYQASLYAYTTNETTLS